VDIARRRPSETSSTSMRSHLAAPRQVYAALCNGPAAVG
jgi:hypothetical protein